ncbi:unnamed protein product [Rotaria sordida]|uniref:Uncharacterized protein n=1 Tax=Rotaria sordida TaxID=392033 RepID=A0A814PED3_9BILA|nr:unnamed protein product [Rotaria sordida]
MMNRLQTELVEQLPQIVLQEQSCNLTNTNQDNNTFVTNPNVNDHQANIRRRAPTRHSIKSLTNRKTLSKQNSTKEHRTCLDPTIQRQYSNSQSSALSDGKQED